MTEADLNGYVYDFSIEYFDIFVNISDNVIIQWKKIIENNAWNYLKKCLLCYKAAQVRI